MALGDDLDALLSLRDARGDRVAKAQRAVDLVRSLGSYRWAGLYDVLPTEIAVIAWSGPEAPTYPRFPIDRGLNGACAKNLAWLWRSGGVRGR